VARASSPCSIWHGHSPQGPLVVAGSGAPPAFAVPTAIRAFSPHQHLPSRCSDLARGRAPGVIPTERSERRNLFKLVVASPQRTWPISENPKSSIVKRKSTPAACLTTHQIKVNDQLSIIISPHPPAEARYVTALHPPALMNLASEAGLMKRSKPAAFGPSTSTIDPEKIQRTTSDNTCQAGMTCGTPENRVLEWRPTLEVCQNSKKNCVLHTNMSLFLCFLRHRILNLSASC